MTRILLWRVRPLPPAVLTAALVLLALAAPAPAATPARVADASYLAAGPGGLRLALVVHDGRLEAYACDGTARRSYFSGRARAGRHVLHSKAGDVLALRLGARRVTATLTLAGGEPLDLTPRRRRVAIFQATIRPDGAVYGTASDGGVLGAHLSATGLVGALAFPGGEPKPFSEPGFARAPLHVDGRPAAYPSDRVAEALEGSWRWIVTPSLVLGATTRPIWTINLGEAVPHGARFTSQVFANQLLS